MLRNLIKISLLFFVGSFNVLAYMSKDEYDKLLKTDVEEACTEDGRILKEQLKFQEEMRAEIREQKKQLLKAKRNWPCAEELEVSLDAEFAEQVLKTVATDPLKDLLQNVEKYPELQDGPVAIRGDVGSGRSTFVQALALHLKRKCYVISFNEPYYAPQLLEKIAITIKEIGEKKEPCILLFKDYNFPENAQGIDLTWHKICGMVKAHKNIIPVATTSPSYKASTSVLDFSGKNPEKRKEEVVRFFLNRIPIPHEESAAKILMKAITKDNPAQIKRIVFAAALNAVTRNSQNPRLTTEDCKKSLRDSNIALPLNNKNKLGIALMAGSCFVVPNPFGLIAGFILTFSND